MSLSCKRVRSFLVQCLLFMVFLVHIRLNSAAILNNKNKQKICLKSVCNATAKNVLSHMKTDVDPCNDFYQFACGGFLENSVIPSDKPGIDEFYILEDKVNEELRNILSEERSTTDPKHLQFPNQLYKACMNTELTEQLGVSPIQSVADSLGGWPVIKGDVWDPYKNWTWVSLMKDFRSQGLNFNYILYFGVEISFTNSSKRNLFIDDSAIAIDREYLIKGLSEPYVSAYYNLSVDVAVLFGVNRDIAKKEMLEALHFEIELANISLSAEDRRDANNLHNLYTIQQMKNKWSYVDWLEYANSLLLPDIQVDETEVINVVSLKFMDDLEILLDKTPKRTVANYVMWRLHFDSLPFLPKAFTDKLTQFNSFFSGVKVQPPQWKRCIKQVNSNLAIPIGSLYVQKYFKNNTKTAATVMIDNIRTAFHDMLSTEDWMDKKTKKEALNKLKSMQEVVGYPDELVDNEILAEYYQDLKIDHENYFKSILNIDKFDFDKVVRGLRLPVDKKDWRGHSTPTTVNAYYVFQENLIQIPAAILQGSFFNDQLPEYMNYGSIGWLIGHEITHGFDDEGSQYDTAGNLVNWWQNSTRQAYLEKANCLVDQYSNYTESTTRLQINGVLTQGENIADNGGLRETYLAYKKWAQKNEPEPQLPGLEYTPEQMFWISAAQLWCSKLTDEFMKSGIETDSHSPTEFRINGSFKNRKEFAIDFKCATGSPMNPLEKCQLW